MDPNTTFQAPAQYRVRMQPESLQEPTPQAGQSRVGLPNGDLDRVLVCTIQQMRGYLQGPNTFEREGDRLSPR